MATVLALDVGSSSVRAQGFDDRAEPVDELCKEEYEGGDPDEIVSLVRKAIGGRDEDAAAIGSSCFGHSLIALDAAGRPLTPVLGWRDTRSAGAAEWLGCIEPQYLEPEPVPIRRSVLSWFRAGCTGLVLLSRLPLDQYRILTGCVGGIIAQDATHRAELRRALQRPFRIPRILITEPEYRGDVAA